MKLKIKQYLIKYYPLIILLISLIVSYICVSYRKRDWVTGGLLFQVIILPILSLQLISILGYYLQDKLWLKRLFLIVEILAALGLLIFTLIYIIKYN